MLQSLVTAVTFNAHTNSVAKFIFLMLQQVVHIFATVIYTAELSTQEQTCKRIAEGTDKWQMLWNPAFQHQGHTGLYRSSWHHLHASPNLSSSDVLIVGKFLWKLCYIFIRYQPHYFPTNVSQRVQILIPFIIFFLNPVNHFCRFVLKDMKPTQYNNLRNASITWHCGCSDLRCPLYTFQPTHVAW